MTYPQKTGGVQDDFSAGELPPADDCVQHLLDLLKDGPRSRSELVEALGVKRGVFQNRYLNPARARGLVVATQKGSSPNQRYKLSVAPCDRLDTSAWQALPTLTSFPSKIEETGVVAAPKATFPTTQTFVIAPADTQEVRLGRYRRWHEGERTVIFYWRVERYLRSMFFTMEWKKLGVVISLNATVFKCCNDTLFSPGYWGGFGGITLVGNVWDHTKTPCPTYVVGEKKLLSLFGEIPLVNIDMVSATEMFENIGTSCIFPVNEISLMNYYGQKFNVPRDLIKPYHGEGRAMQPVAVDPLALAMRPEEKIVFHGKGRAMHHALIRAKTIFGNMLLPAAYYASALNPTLYCLMPEMPDYPVLYNSDAFAAHPDAEIILSDEIGIPLVNASDQNHRIFSTWYGGLEVIEHLDFDLLRGHRIFWLCFDDGAAADPAEKFKKALRVAGTFRKHGINMRFLVFDKTMWTPNGYNGTEVGSYDNVRELSQRELAAEASKFGVGDRKNAAARAMTMDELINTPEREFVLYPVLKEGTYCLIYGGTGAAKTWFALHVAIAISQGASPLDNWVFRGKPRNVLYVAGEMELDAFGSRIKVLLAREKTNLRFRLVVKDDFDLTTETDQAKVVDLIRECESRVVIIDNLSTLAANGHTEGQFEKILKFFKCLQRQGITVLMVHHENREGGFKGSGKIELVADQSLHLFNTGKGDKIELLVKAEKIRMTARSEQGSFRTEFDTKNPCAVWPVFPLTEEERRRLNEDDPLDEIGRNIGKKRNNRQLAWRFMTDDARAVAIIDDMLSGCPDDVIAANLVVREQALRIFKDEQGICDNALKMHLEEAAREVSREIGPDTPPTSDVLAPKIWALIKKERTKK